MCHLSIPYPDLDKGIAIIDTRQVIGVYLREFYVCDRSDVLS